MSWTQYFAKRVEFDAQFPILPVRESVCDDCAIKTGFYTEISMALKNETPQVQRAMSEKWYCHNDTHRACRGNSNLLGITSELEKSGE